MNPRVTAIKNEAIKTAKSFSGIAVTLGGGIIPFVCYWIGWMPSVKITIFIPLAILAAFLVLLTWNMSRYAEEGYWHDRKYKLIHNKWKYFPNPDLQTLRAECYGERHLTCLNGSISYTTIGVGPRENFVPFNPNDEYEISLDPQSRREHGTMRVRPPHRKEGASFSFRIDFTPPLTEGEEAFVKFKFVLPKFKISTLEYLREKCSQANLDARDYEYNSFKIDYPTEKFIYELHFSPKCCAKAKKIEVERGTAIYYQEQLCAQKNGTFSCQDADGGLIMKLERNKPPMNVRYRLLWDLPRTQELIAALQT